MDSRSHNINFTSYNGANEVVAELFESLRSRYQGNLEIFMRVSNFIFDSIQLCYKCHKVNSRRVFYILIPQTGQKRKKLTINLKNTDDNFFQYAATVALNYKKINWNPEKVSDIKPFINKHNWKGINQPSKIDDWETFEQNNPTIVLNILHIK